MSTRRNNPLPPGKSKRLPDALPYRRQSMIHNDPATGRVVVVETIHAAEDVIRISIETARSAWQPERIIMF